MALQDLTPQLRTRLSRMERAVGWFVMLATALLLFGFGYYIYKTAERKGWFTPKFEYQTSSQRCVRPETRRPGDTHGRSAPAKSPLSFPMSLTLIYGLTIEFTILKPHYGYIWD